MKTLKSFLVLITVLLLTYSCSNKVKLGSPEFAKACRDSFPTKLDTTINQIVYQISDTTRYLNLIDLLNKVIFSRDKQIDSLIRANLIKKIDTVNVPVEIIKQIPAKITEKTIKVKDSSYCRVINDSLQFHKQLVKDLAEVNQKLNDTNKQLKSELESIQKNKPKINWFWIALGLGLILLIVVFLFGRRSKA